MSLRLGQLARHISRPSSAAFYNSCATRRSGFVTSPTSSAYVAMSASGSKSSMIHTAACLIIGDEVLGGKTVDTNSAWFAKYCFSLGISLKRVEVIADDEGEIIEAVRRMSNGYDMVVTSGGIGPTHDDITYQSIAKAFNLPLVLHEQGLEKMKKLSRPHPSQPDFSWDVDSPALQAKLRMMRLPYNKDLPDKDQVVFVADDLWVPINVVNGNVHILPGIPRLFEKMLTGLKPSLLPRLVDPEGEGVHRILLSTPLAESAVAGYLTELAGKVESKGVKVGSYPRWGKSRNEVTLVGRDKDYLESLVAEVETGVQGRRIQFSGEDDDDGSDKDT